MTYSVVMKFTPHPFLLYLLVFPFLSEAQKVYSDQVFEENIQTVQLFPASGDFSAQMSSPVIALRSPVPLVLQFDDIAYEADRYSAKIIHCNADWTRSGLRDADYLEQYNEFNVDNYEYSINTRVPYIHYTFQIPGVSRSGNYIIKVYRGRDESNTLFTRRFMVYDNQLAVGASVVPPSKNEDRRTAQQINVNVSFSNRELIDPLNSTTLVIRQNQRWDNAIVGLKYNNIREDLKQLQYQLFDGSNTFEAGNEFRFVDLRYVRTRGRNIAAVRMEEDVVFAEAGEDQPRKGQSYLEYLDINGQYGIFNVERQNHELESEYVLLTFNLESAPLSSPPVVLGALSNWGKNPNAKMVYDQATGRYQATLFLKQGWYDYQYAVRGDSGWKPEPFEGNHFQTENEYEVFFYYRDMGSRYDELIGYTILNPNKRRF
ncbi:protein of unknown function [Cyclobacterium lianum]|uniref:Type 9 secretion system plug protein N-terminal domain-containing protein n=1 Tax=Cyclobacterium lianum TaxID=388280 RepID=A0A1M7PD50_9BACT|nr:DUF5103 domain-containing protein [Cyclobacterium lianum]SHN14839.1 protein of unknown function [Cyclobacterium lianum]